MRFQSIANTLNISHGHKFTGLLGRRTQVKSFKLTSMSHNNGHKTVMKSLDSSSAIRRIKEVRCAIQLQIWYRQGKNLYKILYRFLIYKTINTFLLY